MRVANRQAVGSLPAVRGHDGASTRPAGDGDYQYDAKGYKCRVARGRHGDGRPIRPMIMAGKEGRDRPSQDPDDWKTRTGRRGHSEHNTAFGV